MNGVYRFFRHSYLSYKALFGWLDPKIYLLVMVLNPLSQLLFFAMLVKYVYHGVGLSGYIASNALLLCVMNSVFGIMSVITSDRRMGTLQIVMNSPANKAGLFISRSLAHVFNGFFTAVIGLLFGMLVFHIKFPFTTFGVLIIIWMVSIFSACGFGLIIGSFCLWSPSMHMWSNLLASLLLLLSGANYSLEAMPVWVRIMAQCVPLTRGVELTKAIINNDDYSKVGSLLTHEFLLGCVGFLISLIMIKYAEYLSRIKGTMDLD